MLRGLAGSSLRVLPCLHAPCSARSRTSRSTTHRLRMRLSGHALRDARPTRTWPRASASRACITTVGHRTFLPRHAATCSTTSMTRKVAPSAHPRAGSSGVGTVGAKADSVSRRCVRHRAPRARSPLLLGLPEQTPFGAWTGAQPTIGVVRHAARTKSDRLGERRCARLVEPRPKSAEHRAVPTTLDLT